jgi:hypothetical protein
MYRIHHGEIFEITAQRIITHYCKIVRCRLRLSAFPVSGLLVIHNSCCGWVWEPMSLLDGFLSERTRKSITGIEAD